MIMSYNQNNKISNFINTLYGFTHLDRCNSNAKIKYERVNRRNIGFTW